MLFDFLYQNGISFTISSITESLKQTILNIKPIMALLGVSERTLRKYREEGYLPYTKIGDKFFYSDEDIRRFLMSNHYDAFRLPKKN